jgi:hypothetical protein
MLPSLSAKDIHNAGHLSFSCLIICRERVSLLCREWKRKKSFSCREWAPLPAVASFFSLFASCARHANCAYYINTLTVHIIQTHWLCISYRHTDCAYHTDTLTVRITQTHWLCVSYRHANCAYHTDTLTAYHTDTLTVHIIQTHWLCVSHRHADCAYHTDTLTVCITQTHWLCVSQTTHSTLSTRHDLFHSANFFTQFFHTQTTFSHTDNS